MLSMLLDAELHKHINHKNILHIRVSLQCRQQWISYVDEYGSKLQYVEGSVNVVADNFSWLLWNDTLTSSAVGKNDPLIIIMTKVMSMRHLSIIICHRLMTEKCLIA
jgi:hypothetical protein